MKKIISQNIHVAVFICLLLVTVLASHFASAQNIKGEQLTQEKRCYACHHMTQTLIGPPYNAIAARHNGKTEKDMVARALARKIILGGGGSWGVIPMFPNEHVSEDEAIEISNWILGLSDSR